MFVFDGLVLFVGIAADAAESGGTIAVVQKLFPPLLNGDGFFVLCWNRYRWLFDQPGFPGLRSIQSLQVPQGVFF